MNSALTLDIPFARKVLEHLLAHPDEHAQGQFGVHTSCGTTACIAGTAVLMDPESKIQWTSSARWEGEAMTGVQVGGTLMDVEDRARELFGITHWDANQLFYNFDDASALDAFASLIAQAEAAQ